MTFALVNGVLHREPERRTSKNGKAFVTASLRCKDGDGSAFWRVTGFSESACDELLRLKAGDAVSVQGQMKAELYQPEGGEPRLSLSVIADHVLALRQPAKQRPRAERRPGAPYRMAEEQLNDPPPF